MDKYNNILVGGGVLPNVLDMRSFKILNIIDDGSENEEDRIRNKASFAKLINYYKSTDMHRKVTIIAADTKEEGLIALGMLAKADNRTRRKHEEQENAGSTDYNMTYGNKTIWITSVPIFDGSLIPDTEFNRLNPDTIERFNQMFQKKGLPAAVMINGKGNFGELFLEGLQKLNDIAGYVYIVVARDVSESKEGTATKHGSESEEGIESKECIESEEGIKDKEIFDREINLLRDNLDAEVIDISMKRRDRVKLYTEIYEKLAASMPFYKLGPRIENVSIVNCILDEGLQYPGKLMEKVLYIISQTKLWNTTLTKSDFKRVLREMFYCRPDCSDYYDSTGCIIEPFKSKEVRCDENTGREPDSDRVGEVDLDRFKKSDADRAVKADVRGVAKIDFDKEFSEFEGMEDTKNQIKSIINMFKYQKIRRAHGLDDVVYSNVYLFVGPPGTAKTSFAAKLGEILYQSGYLDNNKIKFITGAQLKGKYMGHSAPKVEEMFRENSMIFIDEAYSLISGDGERDSFANEAIAELLVQIEKHAGDRVVILAGYGGEKLNDKDNKMKAFLDANPGIASRINRTICFNQYTAKESLAITKKIAGNKGFKIDENTEDILLKYFDGRVKETDFGNGRECRSLIENSIMSLSNRVVGLDENSITEHELSTISFDDISNAVNELEHAAAVQNDEGKSKHRLGFAAK